MPRLAAALVPALLLLVCCASPTLRAPLLVDRTETSLVIGWSFPEGVRTDAFVLSMGGRDVWTGTGTSHALTHLDPDTCYTITLRASTDAGSTEDSPPLRAATRAGALTNAAQIAMEVAALRKRLIGDILADVVADPCALASYSKPQYLGGGRSRGLHFRAQLGYTARLAPAMSAINCALARCSSQASETRRWGSGRVGWLATLKPGPGAGGSRGGTRVPVTVRLHGDRPALTFSDPTRPSARLLVPLSGCRARHVAPRAGVPCFSVICASEAEGRTFCSLPPGSGAGAPVDAAAAAVDVREWVTLLNRAAHGVHAPGRFEADIVVSPASPPVDDERRSRAHGVLEVPAVRAAWTASFLSTLPALGVCPHFQRLLDVFVCRRLPPRFADPAVLPPLSDGAVALGVVDAAVADGAGSSAAPAWVATISGTTHTDLGTVLRALGPGALSPRFFAGILAQLVWALGVARHAFVSCRPQG